MGSIQARITILEEAVNARNTQAAERPSAANASLTVTLRRNTHASKDQNPIFIMEAISPHKLHRPDELKYHKMQEAGCR